MNISKVNANIAKVYAQTQKKLNIDDTVKDKSQEKYLTSDEKIDVNISKQAKNLNVTDFAKDRIKGELNKEVSPEKISQIKNMLKSGNYYVNTAALVSAILDGK